MHDVLVDTTVWIDYFNGKPSSQANLLHSLVDHDRILIGDLILTEVLQGFRTDKEFNVAKHLLDNIKHASLVGYDVAIASAKNFRLLRKNGITVRKTIDVIIGTYCILNDITLLHCDRDFDPMVKYLNLQVL